MFIINCPYCGERDQQEFKAGGVAHKERPKQPTELSVDEWAEYLFMRKNIKGLYFNCGWGTGGFKATPGSGDLFAHTIANDEPHKLNADFNINRFVSGDLVDEHGAAAVAH